MARKTADEGQFRCPVYEILERLCRKSKGTPAFFDHIKKAQVELLLAVRSVIDQRVEHLTRQAKAKAGAQRIKVTEEE